MVGETEGGNDLIGDMLGVAVGSDDGEMVGVAVGGWVGTEVGVDVGSSTQVEFSCNDDVMCKSMA